MEARLCATPCAWGVWFPDDPTQVSWASYLDQVGELGFTRTELGPPGYIPGDAEAIRRALAERSLSAVGAFTAGPLHDAAALPTFREEVLRTAQLVQEAGGRYVVIFADSYRGDWLSRSGVARRPRRLEGDAWRHLVAGVSHLAGAVADRFGEEVLVCFHPHADSNVESPEDLERLLEETDPATVRVCLDTGHYACRGGDPVAFMRAHGERVPYLHLKNVDAKVRDRVERDDLPLYTAVAEGVFTEPADGVVDFAALAAVLRDIEWNGDAAIEQDLYPCGVADARPVVRRTLNTLTAVGFTR